MGELSDGCERDAYDEHNARYGLFLLKSAPRSSRSLEIVRKPNFAKSFHSRSDVHALLCQSFCALNLLCSMTAVKDRYLSVIPAVMVHERLILFFAPNNAIRPSACPERSFLMTSF